MRTYAIAILPLALATAACGSTSQEPAPSPDGSDTAPIDAGASAAPARAIATLRTGDATDAGTATLLPAGTGMRLAVQVKGLAPGEHGIHIHTAGQCVGPKFESAGGHWNPVGKQHGTQNAAGPHAGDLPNLTVGPDGSGILNTTLSGTVADLLDADGAAVVVHAQPDDMKTDPSGNSGDRIACGVLGSG